MSLTAPQTLAELKAQAARHKLFVIDLTAREGKPAFALYRMQPDRNVRVGRASSFPALRRLVARAAGSNSGD